MSFELAAPEFLPMHARDLDEVAALEAHLQAFPWTQGHFADSLTAGHSVWVLRSGSQLIGFAVVMVVLDEAHLLNIGVDARLHGQGFGAREVQQPGQRERRQGGQQPAIWQDYAFCPAKRANAT